MSKLIRKLPGYRKLLRQCDEEFSKRIRERDAGSCKVCDRAIVQCVYHIIPRSWLGVRWDPQCGVGSCFGCNKQEMIYRAGPKDHILTIWRPRLGQEYIDRLYIRGGEVQKLDVTQLAEKLTYLKQVRW